MQIIKEIGRVNEKRYYNWYVYSKQKYEMLIKKWNSCFQNSNISILEHGKFYETSNNYILLEVEDNYSLMDGNDMLQFIKENDNEAMYFTKHGDEFIPDKNKRYLVGFDEYEKNAVVFAYKDNDKLVFIK